jgi:NagD protein
VQPAPQPVITYEDAGAIPPAKVQPDVPAAIAEPIPTADTAEETPEVPDYVIIGETSSYNIEMITKAIRLVNNGARLIATNSDLTAPAESGIVPACRALIAPIEVATGKQAYYVGKPNPLMMRTGLKLLGAHSAETVMIGDRMDTDIIAGIESGMDSVLVLSGVTSREDLQSFPYRPRLILNGVGDIPAAANAKQA